MQFFDPPSSRAKFERNLYFLAEKMRQGEIHIASNLSLAIDGIRRVRLLPNRRIDLLSIDEVTRLTANTLMHFIDRRPGGPDSAASDEEDEPTAPERGEDEE